MLTIFAVIVVLVLVGVLFFAISKKGKEGNQKKYGNTTNLDKIFVQNKWQEIEQTFSLGGPSHFKSSIMEADKLVDYVLKAKGVRGETFGERLKNASNKFSNHSDYNNLWFAHKVRNNIAHDSTHDLNSAEAKKAIDYYNKALRELGAI